MNSIGNLHKTKFQERVYRYLLDKVPSGKVTTYGAIAKVLDSSPRAVGQALRCNPYAPKVPCHRVVSASGHIGGFMGQTSGKEIQIKIELLKKEGIKIIDSKIDKKYFK